MDDDDGSVRLFPGALDNARLATLGNGGVWIHLRHALPHMSEIGSNGLG